jgi:DNA-binding NtrC family response regulator
MSSMASTTLNAPAREGAPLLRLVPVGGAGRGGEQSLVLVAGRDPDQRAAVLEELIQTLPPSTVFEQADAFWEVLQRAPDTRMVVLSGDLEDVTARSLPQILSHRHPDLPVVNLA